MGHQSAVLRSGDPGDDWAAAELEERPHPGPSWPRHRLEQTSTPVRNTGSASAVLL
jgi:hypothetical protein